MRITASIMNELNDVLEQISPEQVALFEQELMGTKRVFGAGIGRSGLMMKAFVMRLMHMGLQAFVIGETTTPSIQHGDLLVMGSGSGETKIMLQWAQKAKSLGVRIALVTANQQSSLASLADVLIEIPAYSTTISNNRISSIQPLGSQFEQSLFIVLESTIPTLMKRLSVTQEQMTCAHANLE